MNKEQILIEIRKSLDLKLKLAKAAVMEAYETATDRENVAENKYDTKGLEASYLVQGQARRLEELDRSVSAFREMSIPAENSLSIQLGTLICVEIDAKKTFLFVGPQAGGLKVEVGGEEILVITPYSPIGKSLTGRKEGDVIEIAIGRKKKKYEIINFR
jgi:transcription elongation GreA/GreB family factor